MPGPGRHWPTHSAAASCRRIAFALLGRINRAAAQSEIDWGSPVTPPGVFLGVSGIDIVNAAFSPDNAHLVYCVREGDWYNLRVLDFSVDPAIDTALTNDGVSCDPEF